MRSFLFGHTKLRKMHKDYVHRVMVYRLTLSWSSNAVRGRVGDVRLTKSFWSLITTTTSTIVAPKNPLMSLSPKPGGGVNGLGDRG